MLNSLFHLKVQSATQNSCKHLMKSFDMFWQFIYNYKSLSFRGYS